jgi:hypothetical protein
MLLQDPTLETAVILNSATEIHLQAIAIRNKQTP